MIGLVHAQETSDCCLISIQIFNSHRVISEAGSISLHIKNNSKLIKAIMINITNEHKILPNIFYNRNKYTNIIHILHINYLWTIYLQYIYNIGSSIHKFIGGLCLKFTND